MPPYGVMFCGGCDAEATLQTLWRLVLVREARRLPVPVVLFEPMGEISVSNTTQKLIADIDEAELCCLILEGMSGLRRPSGMSPAQVLAMVDRETQDGARRAATKVVNYWRDRIAFARSVS